MPRSMQRVTTSWRLRLNSAWFRSARSQLPPWKIPGTIWSTRFQWPPKQTAETIQPVLPHRRYSMSGL